MRRELRYAIAALRSRRTVGLASWSVPEALPAAVSGLVIARAIDDGFLAGRPSVGLAWLGGLLLAAGVGAVGSRQVYRRLGDLVEPVRDDLVRRVVDGALARAVSGAGDDGATSRLTRQVEIVRDSFAGLVVAVRGFIVTALAAAVGLASLAPAMALLVLPPFLLGVAAFLATLGLAAARYRASVAADERLATAAGEVFTGTRDLVARGAEGHAAAMVIRPIAAQAAAERALAGVAALRTGCFLIGGWLPLVALLVAGPWLAGRGYGAGALMGGLTYVLVGLQPALNTLVSGLGRSGLRYAVTLARILETSDAPPPRPRRRDPAGARVVLSGVTFGYGPHAEPVLRALDLTVPEGDHLAIVGRSGIGKSTLAGLVCGLLRPDTGTVLVGDVPAHLCHPAVRVLIPQEAYVFSGTLRENLSYLQPDATDQQIERAAEAIGAAALLERLGGPAAEVRPADLSAGERQLVALVRAYLSPAPLAVLDEATCHLDPAAERRAEQAFAARGRTLIVIAHRISSALRARRVLVLDGARARVGDHTTLVASSPLYRELVGHWETAPVLEIERPGSPERQIQPAS